MSIIDVKNIKKEYQYYEKELGLKGSIKNLLKREKLTKTAVNDISFQIDEGEIVGFLGPNGAGKTTTLKMLSGILFPTSGDAKIMDYVPWQRKKEYKMKFAIVMGQKSQLWWDLPAVDSLYLNKCIYEVSDQTYKKRLNEFVELFDVKDLLKVPVRRLSLGERMKFELMASMIHGPRVIFLDEPTIGLDFISQKRIIEFLKYYNKQTKTTILLTSHYMKDIEELCNRAIVINHGNLVFDGSLESIRKEFGEKKLIQFRVAGNLDKERIQQYGKIEEWNGSEVKLEVDHQKIQSIMKEIMQTMQVYDFSVQDIPLESLITSLYQRGNEV